MDYFGVTDMDDVEVCPTEECDFKKMNYGSFQLPFCIEKCMEKNLFHLMIENMKLKGDVETFRSMYLSLKEAFEKAEKKVNLFVRDESPKRDHDGFLIESRKPKKRWEGELFE